MTNIILFMLWLISGGIAIYIQLKHAWTNYPESLGWLFVRFGSAFFNGAILGVLLFYREFQGIQLVTISFLTGVAIGILLTFISQARIRRLIPRREIQKENSVRE